MSSTQTATVLPASASEKIAADWGHLTWVASGKLGNSDELTCGICRIKPGCANPLHKHPTCSEVLTVLSGSIAHTVAEGKTVDMHEGDTITIPAGMYHHAQNIGAGEAVLLVVFPTPNRTFEK